MAGIFEGRYGIVERHLTRCIYKGKEVVLGGDWQPVSEEIARQSNTCSMGAPN